MSVAAEIIVTRNSAEPALNALIAQCRPERLAAIIGPGCKIAVQNHLLANGKNKRGWPTTNFWAGAARSTTWTSDATGLCTISINQIGVRQRYYGGEIRPVRAKALSIPISPEAYGKVPSDFPGAFLLKTAKGAYLVQRGEQITARGTVSAILGRKGRGLGKDRVRANLEFLFKLCSSVTQEGDTSVIPDEAALAQVAMTTLREDLVK